MSCHGIEKLARFYIQLNYRHAHRFTHDSNLEITWEELWREPWETTQHSSYSAITKRTEVGLVTRVQVNRRLVHHGGGVREVRDRASLVP